MNTPGILSISGLVLSFALTILSRPETSAGAVKSVSSETPQDAPPAWHGGGNRGSACSSIGGRSV